MKELFVSRKIAELAKEKGFDEPCFAYFNGNSPYIMSCGRTMRIDEYWGFKNSSTLAAPLYQQIIDWFYTNHQIVISIYMQRAYTWSILIESIDKSLIKEVFLDTTEYIDKYEAINKGLLEAFKLI